MRLKVIIFYNWNDLTSIILLYIPWSEREWDAFLFMVNMTLVLSNTKINHTKEFLIFEEIMFLAFSWHDLRESNTFYSLLIDMSNIYDFLSLSNSHCTIAFIWWYIIYLRGHRHDQHFREFPGSTLSFTFNISSG